MRRMTALLTAAAAGAGLLAGAGLAGAEPETAGRGGAERFYQQRLDWKACGDQDLDAAGAQCAEVTVPLDYQQPQGRTLTVAISRLKAADPGQRRGIMLSNPGGPGGPGLGLPLKMRPKLSPDVLARYDLIGMDPRGVGRSNPVDCAWPVGFMLRSSGLDRAGFDRTVALQADLARRCARTQGDTLRHITTRNTARDMDVVRGAMGERKISYFGYSYGTYLGSVYTQMFPRRSDRIVLDSAVDSKRYSQQMVRDMGPANERALDDWAAWTAARDGEYRLGRTAAQVRGAVEELIRRSARQPIPIGEYRVDEHMLPMVLFEQVGDTRLNTALAETVRVLADAADGKQVSPSPGLLASLHVLSRRDPNAQLSGQAAIMCGDAAVRRDPEWYWRNIQRSRASQPVFGAFANGINPCAFWAEPAEAPVIVRNSVPALIVQATEDTRTAYDSGVDLHRAMSGSRLITLPGVRAHGLFSRYPNGCMENAVNTYLRDGVLPSGDLTCRGD